MPRPTSVAKGAAPLRMVLLTMDHHLASAAARAMKQLHREMPTLELSVHTASSWRDDQAALARCRDDIAQAHLIVASMLFMEDHFIPVLADLQARRNECDAMVCIMSAPEVMRLVRMGRYVGGEESTGLLALLRRFKPGARRDNGKPHNQQTAGAKQMAMLRRLPSLLRFVPGTAQDLRVFFLVMRYWLAGSEDNLANLIRMLVQRYAQGPRAALAQSLKVGDPIEYPEVGLYHPQLKPRLTDRLQDLPGFKGKAVASQATVGVLLLRSYLLSGNTAHYDAVIEQLESRGLRVIPAFASGLDARAAVDQFFVHNGESRIDALVSLTGFSLVGGPAYNNAEAAELSLRNLDVPYLTAHPLEFQTLPEWAASNRGLLPVESTIMVAIPELDGATSPMVFGGRAGAAGETCTGCSRACRFENASQHNDMFACAERSAALAERVLTWTRLRKTARQDRRLAIVLFNFPPHSGNVGTAAFLSVFESLHHTLKALSQAGWRVDIPSSVDELRERILGGNASTLGTPAHVHARIPVADHIEREVHLAEIEAEWGPAPGDQLTDGQHLLVQGVQLGEILVAVQPGMGYEGDPMRLMFERGCAPTHAFSAFYRYLREDFAAHAILHFGTHGALEFMPGKQTALSAKCWPERLLGAVPHVYLYAANNPSEGALAKRRSGATLVSHLTPAITEAGLYKELEDMRQLLDRWRSPDCSELERQELPQQLVDLAKVIELQAPEHASDLSPQAWQAWTVDVQAQLLELSYTLIPDGLHVVGRSPSPTERLQTLKAMAQAMDMKQPEWVERIVEVGTGLMKLPGFQQLSESERKALTQLAQAHEHLMGQGELQGLLRALDGRYISPAPGGDLLRNPEMLPTGRNLHGMDPFRMPSNHAVKDGALQAERLLARHREDTGEWPETVAMVLWGTDNLKSEGGPLSQALALMGAKPRFDNYGRLAGAELIPLAQLGRPRIDVVITLSGIFRDLLPMQIRLLAQAAQLAASADEDPDQNFVRRHALAFMQANDCDMDTASLRVFGNAEGAYGSNVNHLIDSGCWNDEDELGNAFTQRKGFAYDTHGKPQRHNALLAHTLASVSLTYQNIDSVQLGVTSIDTYFDTLGGISRAVWQARQANNPQDTEMPPVYIGDQTQSAGVVRTLSEQVSLETRTRMLNPKWHESMLQHGYEGVRHIEAHLTNTLGWSATTGQVKPWVYQQLAETFILDPQMRARMAALNPAASSKFANRLLEASRRRFWQPDEQTLQALQLAGAELEDRLEGIQEGLAA